MKCEEVQKLLHPFFDGELDVPAHVQVEEHLAGCKECASQEQELQSLRNTIASAPLYHRARPRFAGVFNDLFASSTTDRVDPFRDFSQSPLGFCCSSPPQRSQPCFGPEQEPRPTTESRNWSWPLTSDHYWRTM